MRSRRCGARRRPGHLRTRLALAVTGVAAAVLVATEVLVVIVMMSYLHAKQDQQMLAVARRVSAVAATGRVQPIAWETLEEVSGRPGLLLVVVDGGRPVPLQDSTAQLTLAEGLGPLPAGDPRWADTAVHEVDVTGAGTYRYVLVVSPGVLVTTPDGVRHDLTGVVLAMSRRGDDAVLSRLALVSGVLTVPALLCLGLGTWLALRRGLAPLERMAAAAPALARSAAVPPAPEPGAPAEVQALQQALHDALQVRAAAEETHRRFVADAGHELRTPTTAVRGWADLYLQGGLTGPDAVDRAMERILRQADEMGLLVDELLLLAQLDAPGGTAPTTAPDGPGPCDLLTVARDAAADAAVLSGAHHVHGPDPGAPVPVAVPPAHTARMVRNLVANAVRHTPPGTRVQVRVAAGGPADRSVVLEVQDDGPGVPAAERDLVLGRFYRGVRARARGGGSGLGLSIVQALARAHGGRLQLLDAPDGGPGLLCRLELPGAG